jgi:membrane protein
MISTSRKFGQVVLKSFKDFIADDALKYSASLSYYTVFSIAPMLIIIIGMAGLFFGEEAVSGEVFRQFSGLMGPNVAELLQQAIKNVKLSGQSWTATIVGFLTLLIGATGVFAEMQDSLNKIWSLKTTVKTGWLKYLINRLVSFSMVLTLSFLLMVSLLINALITLLSTRYLTILNDWQWLSFIINNAIILGIVTLLFAFIFKFLPDVRLRWANVASGAFFTAILFSIGKYLIGTYLSQSAIASAFGAAGSLALILLWVYYSSSILFFGAEFTKNYAVIFDKPVEADVYATFVVTKEKELSSDANVGNVEEIKDKQAK